MIPKKRLVHNLDTITESSQMDTAWLATIIILVLLCVLVLVILGGWFCIRRRRRISLPSNPRRDSFEKELGFRDMLPAMQPMPSSTREEDPHDKITESQKSAPLFSHSMSSVETASQSIDPSSSSSLNTSNINTKSKLGKSIKPRPRSILYPKSTTSIGSIDSNARPSAKNRLGSPHGSPPWWEPKKKPSLFPAKNDIPVRAVRKSHETLD